MSLSELCDAADTRDVDHNGAVMFTALCEQTEERSGDKVNREHVDLVQLCPLFGGFPIKQSHSKGLRVCVLWCVFLVEELGHWAGLPSAEGLVRFWSR